VDSHAELRYRSLRGELQFYFILEPQELSKPAPKQVQSPSRPGFALRLKRPGGSIEIRGAGSGRATGTCFCVARAALFFACVRPPRQKKHEKTRNKKNNPKKQPTDFPLFCFLFF
jgi:hypothetical protein